MSTVRKQFDIAILFMDALVTISKYLPLILVALAAVTFFSAGSAFAEGNMALGILYVALGAGNIVLLMQLRRRIANSHRSNDMARKGSFVDIGA